MRRPIIVLVLVAGFTCLQPRGALAWGLDVHRFIMDRAIDRLPSAIRPFFEKQRAFVVERAVDPDLWRVVGFANEPPRHFVDLDAYGKPPFPDLPRDYDRAVERYGPEFVERNGVLPWRTAEMFGRLQRAFGDSAKGTSEYAPANARLYAAVLAHYVSDAYVPLHAVINYDGQLTKQQGVHARFESELFDRYRSRLSIAPPALPPMTDARQSTFDTLVESFALVEPLLAADRRAAAGRTAYDAGYFDAFFADMQPVLEKRLSQSIAAVAAAITGAWEAAGRPELPVEPVMRERLIKR